MSSEQRRVILIRHAQAQSETGSHDHDRPLTDRGRADAAALGEWLKSADLQPQETRCSTAVRTRETWAEVVQASGLGPIVEHDRRIYQADVAALADVLAELDPKLSSVVLVGHAPGVPQLAAALTDGRGQPDALTALEEGYPTSTVSVIEFSGEWADLADLQRGSAPDALLRVMHTARAD